MVVLTLYFLYLIDIVFTFVGTNNVNKSMVLTGIPATIKDMSKGEPQSYLELIMPDMENAYMFSLGERSVLCSGRSLYEYSKESRTWRKLEFEMEEVRTDVGCISVDEGVIISGGTVWEYNGLDVGGSHCTDSVILLQHDFKTIEIGKLPKPIKCHTMTKISERTFVICGGRDLHNELSDVYCGMWDGKKLRWTLMKPLKHARFNHGAMVLKGKLIVVGGSSHWTGSRKLNRNVEYMEIKKKIQTCQWKKGKDLPFDASNAICNVSCDGEYGIISSKDKAELWDKDSDIIAMMDNNMNVTLLNEEEIE